MEWTFFAEPRAFLDAAGAHLAAYPVLANAVATTANRRVDDPPGAHPSDWYAVARDAAGTVIGTAMRTSAAEVRPAYVGPIAGPSPEVVARLLARVLVGRGEVLTGVDGTLPGASACAEETARLVGGTVEVTERIRLHEVRRPVAPRVVPGRLRVVGEDDLALATEWYAAFHRDAEEQAGRPAGPVERPPRSEMLRRVRSGRAFFWCDADGRPVHLTGSSPPSFGVARIAPVYTPPAERGRGWAAAGVHAVATGLLGEGARVVLYTDQANPTSNALYRRLGFEPVVDQAEHRVQGTARGTAPRGTP